MGKHFYGEWLVPIVDYFRTLKRKEFYYEWLFPCIISIFICICTLLWGDSLRALVKLREILPTTLAILIGFTITSVTVLISSSSANIESLKKKDTDNRLIGSQIIKIYQWMLIIFIYLLMVQIFLLMFIFFVSFIIHIYQNQFIIIVFLFIETFMVIHILLILIRNTTNFYFVFFKNKV